MPQKKLRWLVWTIIIIAVFFFFLYMAGDGHPLQRWLRVRLGG